MGNQIEIYVDDSYTVLTMLPSESVELVIADPPYYNVSNEEWDQEWESEKEYIEWSMKWIGEVNRILTNEGILLIFGQLGKREQVFLTLMDKARTILKYHDLLIWDRVIGYDRKDSFLPAYEMIYVLRKGENPYFSDEVRIPYNEKTIRSYMRDKRYKDMDRRREELNKGKRLTNIISVPSLRGNSKEKVGHPTQKPERLIHKLLSSYSKKGDTVLDPFAGSFTVAKVANEMDRNSINIERDKEYVNIGKERLGIFSQ